MTDKQKIWAERVREWKASGKTLHEFTKNQPYNGLTLKWWGSELRRRKVLNPPDSRPRNRGRGVDNASIPMARVVRRREPRAESSGVVVEIGAARVVVQQDFDAVVLSNVVRALQETQ